MIALLHPDEASQLTRLLAAAVHGCCLRSEINETLPLLIRSVAADVRMVSHATLLSRLSALDDLPDNASLVEQWLLATAVTLTLNERRVLTHLVGGLDNASIANELHLAEQTVRNIVHRLYGKLKLRGRVRLIAAFHRAKTSKPY